MALEWIYSAVAKEEIGITAWYDSSHTAIDFNGHGEAWSGKLLYAGYDGVVITRAYREDRGFYVEIKANTDEGELVIGFCHLSDIYVFEGQQVKATQKIGTMGDTGVSYGVHCHYYVVKDGYRIDPYRVLTNQITQNNEQGVINENGFFTCNVDDLRVRETPSLQGEISGKCQNGKRYSYTKKTIADGYRWIYLNDHDCWTAWATEDRVTEVYGVIE